MCRAERIPSVDVCGDFADYIIGSIHWVVAPDGTRVPAIIAGTAGGRDPDHFSGSAEAFVRAYYQQQRDMVANFDFDVIGHLDLVRKFNVKHRTSTRRPTGIEKRSGRLPREVRKRQDRKGSTPARLRVAGLTTAYSVRGFRQILRERA